jgi:type II secretory pathway component PulK
MAQTTMNEQRGIALIVVLAIVAILSVLVLEFGHSTWVDMYLSSSYDARTQALNAAKAGVEYGIYLLRRDEDTRVDWLGDAWAKPVTLEIGKLVPPLDPDEENPQPEGYWESNSRRVEPRDGGTAHVLIVDEDRKIPLARLGSNPRVQAILTQLIDDLDAADTSYSAPDIVAAMVDWVDLDNDGSWEYLYETLPDPYVAKNQPFDTVGELGLVAEISDRLLYGTVPYPEREPGYDTEDQADWWEAQPTLGPNDSYGLVNFVETEGSTWINVNTAPREVLMAIFDDNELAVDEIMQHRRETAFETEAEFEAVVKSVFNDEARLTELRRMLTVRSQFFTITSVGEYHDIKVKVTAIVYRSSRPDVLVQYYRSESVE